MQLRTDVCNWIEAHKDRYAPFVYDEQGFDFTSSACASKVSTVSTLQPSYILIRVAAGTYGGHLELSAFARTRRRDVKLIQPGLVYVIERDSGGDMEPQDKPPLIPNEVEDDDQEKPLTRRERKC